MTQYELVSSRAAHHFPFSEACGVCLPTTVRHTLDDWQAATAVHTALATAVRVADSLGA